MATMEGRNSNTWDTETSTGPITLNTVTTVTLLPANPRRIGYSVVNGSTGNNSFWVKHRAAAVDNLQDGNYILSRAGFYETPGGEIYKGEVSAIAISDSPVAHVSEWSK